MSIYGAQLEESLRRVEAKGATPMAYSVRMSELREMSEGERAEVIRELARNALEFPNGQAEQINAEIREFERRYEISSERLLEELYQGRRPETAHIARWLWLLDLRERTNPYQAG